MRKTLLLFVICAVTALAGTPAKALGGLPDTYYDFAFDRNSPDGGPITREGFGHEDNSTSEPFEFINNSDSYNHHQDVDSDNYTFDDNGYQPRHHGSDTFSVNDGRGTESGKGDKGAGGNSYKVVSSDRHSPINYNFDSFHHAYGQGGPNDHFFHGDEGRFCGPSYSDYTICPVPEPSQWGWAIFLIVAGATFWRRSFRAL